MERRSLLSMAATGVLVLQVAGLEIDRPYPRNVPVYTQERLDTGQHHPTRDRTLMVVENLEQDLDKFLEQLRGNNWDRKSQLIPFKRVFGGRRRMLLAALGYQREVRITDINEYPDRIQVDATFSGTISEPTNPYHAVIIPSISKEIVFTLPGGRIEFFDPKNNPPLNSPRSL